MLGLQLRLMRKYTKYKIPVFFLFQAFPFTDSNLELKAKNDEYSDDSSKY